MKSTLVSAAAALALAGGLAIPAFATPHAEEGLAVAGDAVASPSFVGTDSITVKGNREDFLKSLENRKSDVDKQENKPILATGRNAVKRAEFLMEQKLGHDVVTPKFYEDNPHKVDVTATPELTDADMPLVREFAKVLEKNGYTEVLYFPAQKQS